MPATAGCEAAPAIGFIAHMDTSPDASGAADEAYVSRRGERRYKRRALQAETTKKSPKYQILRAILLAEAVRFELTIGY